MAVAAFISSCKPDEPGLPPTLSFLDGYSDNQTVNVAPGNSITVKWVANKGDAGMNTFAVVKDGANFAGYNSGSPKTLAGTQRDSYQDSIVIDLAGKYVFRVTDVDGNSDDLTLNVTAQGDPGINSYTAVLMGAQDNTTYGSFYDAESNTVYMIADAKTNAAAVDIVYFYGATNLATLAAPSDQASQDVYNQSTSGIQTWSVKNATMFKTTSLTGSDFNAVATSADINTHASGGTATKANLLASGEVVAFETVGGKKGLVHIGAITTGANGSITLNVKIQK